MKRTLHNFWIFSKFSFFWQNVIRQTLSINPAILCCLKCIQYIILGKIKDNRTGPCDFALMPDKNTESYYFPDGPAAGSGGLSSLLSARSAGLWMCHVQHKTQNIYPWPSWPSACSHWQDNKTQTSGSGLDRPFQSEPAVFSFDGCYRSCPLSLGTEWSGNETV
jgi:hypothetical protein